MATSWPWTRFAISQWILCLFCIMDKRHHPYHRALMLICSDLKRTWKPLCSISQRITGRDFWHLRISTICSEEHSHFWSCQLRFPTHSTSVEVVRKRAYVWSKKWKFFVFFHFYRVWKKSPFHAIFPNSAANMQQSTMKEGENKATRERGQRSPISWSNKSVKRGCDDLTPIGIDNIAPQNKFQGKKHNNQPIEMLHFDLLNQSVATARLSFVYERRYDWSQIHPKKKNSIEIMVSGKTVKLWICDSFSPFLFALPLSFKFTHEDSGDGGGNLGLWEEIWWIAGSAWKQQFN